MVGKSCEEDFCFWWRLIGLDSISYLKQKMGRIYVKMLFKTLDIQQCRTIMVAELQGEKRWAQLLHQLTNWKGFQGTGWGETAWRNLTVSASWGDGAQNPGSSIRKERAAQSNFTSLKFHLCSDQWMNVNTVPRLENEPTRGIWGSNSEHKAIREYFLSIHPEWKNLIIRNA